METKQIIKEVIEAYSGYPNRTPLSRKTLKFIREFDAEKSNLIYDFLLEGDAFTIDPMALERFTLAIGHFQAINKKEVYVDGPIPLKAVDAIDKDKFEHCKKIVSAAGRAWHVLKDEIKGFSPAIIEVKKQTWHACFGKELISSLDFKQAIKDLNVLILGETGTGKELFAKAIQEAAFWHIGHRKAPTASVNVAAFNEDLIDSELFGHTRGAFTGAMKDRGGLIKASDGGTFFLDEVGDLHPGTQVKLLRVIETKKLRKVGSDKEEDADVRYISATNKEIQHNNFRSDLYERLAGTIIHLPPLRDRSEKDIEEIANTIIRQCMVKESDYNTSEEVFQYLRERNKEGYHWPGNVRELQSFIRGVILGINIGGKSGRWTKKSKRSKNDENLIPQDLLNGQWSEAQLKDWYFEKISQLTNNNMTQTARILGVNPSTLLRRRGKNNE